MQKIVLNMCVDLKLFGNAHKLHVEITERVFALISSKSEHT